MTNFLKNAFNVAATAVGGTGAILGTVWTMAEATGFPNGSAFVHPGDLLTAASFTAVSATVLMLGYNRFFFSGKTAEAVKNLFKPKP